MNYPIWELPLFGGGLLIAVVAIVHVYVAHFAVGGGLYLVLAERKARQDRSGALLTWLKGHSRFFLLLTIVFGALTGVGIWWTIALISPHGTALLIRNFVWFWAIEWVFFIVEIAAALLYYYGWDRMSPRTHMLVGWVYAGATWATLLVITGIVSFMLTPGAWVENGSLLSAFFNPGYIPSVIARTASAVSLAGLWGLFTASMARQEDVRTQMVRFSSYWLMPGLVGLVVSTVWFLAVAPAPARAMALGGAAPVSLMFMFSMAVSAVIFFFARFGAFARPAAVSPAAAVAVLVLGLVATGGTEWVREGIRKPFLVYGHLYSNGVYVKQISEIMGRSVLAEARWSLVKAVDPNNMVASGREVFRVQCMSCHTVDGYNAIRPLVQGWNRELLVTNLRHLDKLKGYMPPFTGTEEELQALASYLESLQPAQPAAAPTPPAALPAAGNGGE